VSPRGHSLGSSVSENANSHPPPLARVFCITRKSQLSRGAPSQERGTARVDMRMWPERREGAEEEMRWSGTEFKKEKTQNKEKREFQCSNPVLYWIDGPRQKMEATNSSEWHRTHNTADRQHRRCPNWASGQPVHASRRVAGSI